MQSTEQLSNSICIIHHSHLYHLFLDSKLRDVSHLLASLCLIYFDLVHRRVHPLLR